MISAKLRKGKKGNSVVEQVRKKILNLQKQKVSGGYFIRQGLHEDSGMPLIQLAKIHHYGLQSYAQQQFMDKIGDVFEVDVIRGDLLKEFFVNKGFKTTTLLNDYGSKMREASQEVIGNPVYLKVIRNPTPLQQTSEMKDRFSFNTSLNPTLRK